MCADLNQNELEKCENPAKKRQNKVTFTGYLFRLRLKETLYGKMTLTVLGSNVWLFEVTSNSESLPWHFNLDLVCLKMCYYMSFQSCKGNLSLYKVIQPLLIISI